MRGSTLMFFEYLGMIGIPVLIVLLALTSPLNHAVFGVLRDVLYVLLGLGSIMYGIVSIRTTFFHGGKRE